MTIQEMGSALEAIKNSINFIDSTILGMGRGAGNLQTEKILFELNRLKVHNGNVKGLSITLDDFSKFFIHRFMHKWPILWSIHKVHHSATTLTPMTVFRTHPLEGIIFSLRSSTTQAISISSFIFSLSIYPNEI